RQSLRAAPDAMASHLQRPVSLVHHRLHDKHNLARNDVLFLGFRRGALGLQHRLFHARLLIGASPPKRTQTSTGVIASAAAISALLFTALPAIVADRRRSTATGGAGRRSACSRRARAAPTRSRIRNSRESKACRSRPAPPFCDIARGAANPPATRAL